MIKFFKKTRPQDEEPSRVTFFAVDEKELLLEFWQWTSAFISLLPKEKATTTWDLQTLQKGLQHVIKAVENPNYKIKQNVRAEVMDVLRREHLDQHGLDLLHILRAIRQIALRDAVSANPKTFSAAQDDSCEALRAQLRALQEQNDLLNEVIDKLSHPIQIEP